MHTPTAIKDSGSPWKLKGLVLLACSSMAASLDAQSLPPPSPFLDAGFGTAGSVFAQEGFGEAVVVQADQKILVAGALHAEAPGHFIPRSNHHIGLLRYNPDGSPDASFGTGGRVVTLLSAGEEYAHAAAVQPDGKIVVAAHTYTQSRCVAVLRYEADGTPDPTFNGSGSLITSFGAPGDSNEAESIAIQSDGKILVAGTVYVGGHAHFALLRCNADGSLDTSFNQTGKVVRKHPRLEGGLTTHAMALQPDGRILVAGAGLDYRTGRHSFALARFKADGSLDTSFNGTGFVLTSLGKGSSLAAALALLPDGRILAAGVHEDDMALVRYHPDGSLDTTFNKTGKLTTDFGGYETVSSVLLQNDGKAIAVGLRAHGGGCDYALARYNADGSLDTTLTRSGRMTADLAASIDLPYGAALQADGQVLVTGLSQHGPSHPGNNVALARFSMAASAPQPGADVFSGPPVVENQPLSQVLNLGTGGTGFYATALGTPPFKFQWFKNGARIPGATERTLGIPEVTAASAARYQVQVTNAQGSVMSHTAYVAVVDPLTPVTTAVEGGVLQLRARVESPPGAPIAYRWSTKGAYLDNGGRISGAGSKVLKISAVQFEDEGGYACEVTIEAIPGASSEGGPLDISCAADVIAGTDRPVLDPVTLPDSTVNDPVSTTLTVANGVPVDRFSARGLPPGVQIHPVRGTLSGRPAKAKMAGGVPVPYTVVFTAANAAGESDPWVVQWLVRPFPQELARAFQGLVERECALGNSENLTQDLGGTVQFLATTQGGASGVLTLGRQRHPFAGTIHAVDGTGAEAYIAIQRRTPLPPLILHLALDGGSGALSGDVTNGSDYVQLGGWRVTAGVVAPGRYNQALLSTLSGYEDYPQGHGMTSMQINARGQAVWSGRLADGTTLTGSAATGTYGQVCFHQILYKGAGSVQGWVDILSHEDAPATVDGEFTWYKAAQAASLKSRSYASGFPAHSLTVVGGRYTAPNLPASLEMHALDADGGALLVQPFTAANGGDLGIPASPHNLKLRLNKATGIFTGSFTPPTAAILAAATGRPAQAEVFGILVHREHHHPAYGTCLLADPSSPPEPGRTLQKTSAPIRSGTVEWRLPEAE